MNEELKKEIDDTLEMADYLYDKSKKDYGITLLWKDCLKIVTKINRNIIISK